MSLVSLSIGREFSVVGGFSDICNITPWGTCLKANLGCTQSKLEQ